MNQKDETPGLVICAKTVRSSESLPTVRAKTGERTFLSLNPGVVKISRSRLGLQGKQVKPASRRPISAWTPKSRANMISRFSSLDYSEMLGDESKIPVMITLTYPSKWLTVAPTGKAAKAHLTSFRKRFERRYGTSMSALWKMEFQRRGAVHFHLFCVAPESIPLFRDWVAKVWSEIVNHPDLEERERHLKAGTSVEEAAGSSHEAPKRIAVYFAKHASPNFGKKEYQNSPPAEWIQNGKLGRFWGYWNLKWEFEILEISPEEALVVSRVIRKWYRSKREISKRKVFRTDTKTGEIYVRLASKRISRFRSVSGFLSTDSGASLALELKRLIERLRQESNQ